MGLIELAKAKWIASQVDGKMEKGKSPSLNKHSKPQVFHISKKNILHSIKTSVSSNWKNINVYSRSESLRKTSSLLKSHKTLLAKVMAEEMGKPITEGEAEVDYAASFFDWFAGEAERVYGLEVPSSKNEKRCFIRYEPVGPTALITPWNFPLAMPARKVAAALAAGCPVILKPSPEVPLSTLLLQKACLDSGVLPSAFSVLIGDEVEIGKALLESFEIKKLSFTGSVEVGKKLYSKAALSLKKVTLELGGNAPFIIFEDADLKKAVAELMVAKFRNTGQTCVAANRILVHESLIEPFTKLLIKELNRLKEGSPLNKDTDISTTLHPLSIKKVKSQKEKAMKKGAKCVYQKSGFLSPSILYPVDETMAIFNEETFGPLVPITPFKDEKQALRLANKGNFGLAAYVFTNDLSRVFSISEALHYGIIGINDGLPSASYASFGGIQLSGLGREGGPNGIYEYLTEKYLSIRV